MGMANIFNHKKAVSIDMGTAPYSEIHKNIIKEQSERDSHLRDF